MKINGHEVERETIGKIAGTFGIRHSEECRAANPRGQGFRCRCDFFERIGEHLIKPDEAEITEAEVEAQRYFDAGYVQKSRKYRRLSKPKEDGSWDHSGESDVEVSVAIFGAFRRIVNDRHEAVMAAYRAHLEQIWTLAVGDRCEFQIVPGRDQRYISGNSEYEWFPGTVVERNEFSGPWRIRSDSTTVRAGDVVKAYAVNIRLPTSSERRP